MAIWRDLPQAIAVDPKLRAAYEAVAATLGCHDGRCALELGPATLSHVHRDGPFEVEVRATYRDAVAPTTLDSDLIAALEALVRRAH